MIRISIYSVLLIFCLQVTTHAQETILGSINPPLLQKYVDLAKEYYPKRKMYKASELSAKAKVAVARATYFDAFTASYIYRPDNAVALDTTNPYSINGFQLGVHFNIGILFRTPAYVRQAKEEHNEMIYQSKEYDILLESQVKQVYYDYLHQFNTLKVKQMAYNDNKAASDGLQYKFEKGEVSLDDYTKAKSITNYANSERLLAELNWLKAKDTLEALIGEKLENVK